MYRSHIVPVREVKDINVGNLGPKIEDPAFQEEVERRDGQEEEEWAVEKIVSSKVVNEVL